MRECNRICEWNNPSNGCVKPEKVDCKMPNLFKGAKPQTNADRIRAMSDEELAAIILCTKQFDENVSCYGKTCHACALGWLRQPVKEGEGDVG